MRVISIIGALAFLLGGCYRMEVEGVRQNPALENTNVNKTSVPASNPAATAATPPVKKMNDQMTVNESEYTVAKFDQAKMRAATLDQQPLEIIKEIAAFDAEQMKENDSSFNLQEELKRFKTYKIKIAELDLNHDGTAERIVLSRGETGGEAELFSVFTRKNEKWQLIFSIEGDLDEPKVPRIETLTSANKSGFDLIKITAKRGTNDDSQDVWYYRMQGDQYRRVDCYFVDGKTKESVPCE